MRVAFIGARFPWRHEQRALGRRDFVVEREAGKFMRPGPVVADVEQIAAIAVLAQHIHGDTGLLEWHWCKGLLRGDWFRAASDAEGS